LSKTDLAKKLFELAELAQKHGWHAEDLLRNEIKKREAKLRRAETKRDRSTKKHS
jgi:hypothetical protein